MFGHLLPNAVAPVIVIATINLGGFISAEAALSFLGVGVQSPDISWGLMIADARNRFLEAPLPLGRTRDLPVGSTAIVAGAGGRRRALAAKVVGKREFAGYWEYLLEEAIFTAPAHPSWGGGALVGADGKLLGIGSLRLQMMSSGKVTDINMAVPIGLLPPILDELLARKTVAGRPAGLGDDMAWVRAASGRGPEHPDPRLPLIG